MSSLRTRIWILSLAVAALRLGGLAFAGEWSASVDISRDRLGWASWYPSIAVDSFHTLRASWSTHLADHLDYEMYACKPAKVDTWTIPVRISRDSAWWRGSIIAIGPGHVPYVVWQCDEEAGHLYITRKCGDTWSIPERLSTWNGFGTGIRGCSDRFGRIHITWTSTTAGVVFYARYDESGWSRPETVVDHAIGRPTDPDIAVDRQGICHVVFATMTDTVGYVYQTAHGWSRPTRLYSGVFNGGSSPRIAIDTLDQPQVAWWDDGGVGNYHSTYSGRQGDTWTIPRWPDTIEGGPPSLCVDRWNRVHEMFGDGTTTRYAGMREAVWYKGQLAETYSVDSIEGWAEALAIDDEMCLLWTKCNPYGGIVFFSRRELNPPAVEEARETPVTLDLPVSGLVTPLTEIPCVLDRSGRVKVTIFDCTGRETWTQDMQVRGPGCYSFLPYPHLHGPGVFYCRIRAGRKLQTVKLVMASSRT